MITRAIPIILLLLLSLSGCGGTLSQAKLDALEQLPVEERIQRLEDLQAKRPTDQRLWSLLGRAVWETYDGLGSTEKVERLKADLRVEPENAILSKLLGDAFYDLAQGDEGTGYLDSALFAYENAALKAPEYLGAAGSVGALYDEKEDFDQAIYWYQRALDVDPEHVTTICNLGASLYNKGEYSTAMDYYRKALAIDPESQDAHYNLGVAFAEASIYREAILEWEVVFAIDSSTAVGKQAKMNADLLRDVLEETLYRGGKKSRRINMRGGTRETGVRVNQPGGDQGRKLTNEER